MNLDYSMLPQNWKNIELAKVGSFKNGINKSKADFGFGNPFVNLMDVFGKPSTGPQEFDLVNSTEAEVQNYSLKKGDVLFVRSSVKPTGVGLTTLIEEDLPNTVYSGFLIRYRPEGNVFDPSYLRYCFYERGFRKRLLALSTSSANTNINQESLNELSIATPPIKEQLKIAAILRKWDELIEQQSKLIVAKELQKKGLLQKLLTGELRFPGFEKNWKDYVLSDVVSFSNGKAHENIVDENGKYKLVTSKFISTSGRKYRALNNRLSPLDKEDIVMVMSDVPNGKALAKCYFIEEDDLYSLNQRICQFKSKGAYPKFLFYLLNRNQHFLKFDSGVGQTNLRKDDILECPLFIPELEEQKAIANCLDAVAEEIRILTVELNALKSQKRGLMQQLLTGNIRVKN